MQNFMAFKVLPSLSSYSILIAERNEGLYSLSSDLETEAQRGNCLLKSTQSGGSTVPRLEPQALRRLLPFRVSSLLMSLTLELYIG